jgi:DNA-binding response OmpR family regulator
VLRRFRSRSRVRAETGADAPAAGSGALVVVDEEGARELIGRLTDRAGLTPTSVDSRDSAIQALGDELPRVVITLMQGGRGLALVESLRSDERAEVTALPVLVLSDDPELEKKAWAAGGDGFLVRPFHADMFDQALGDVLNRSAEDRVTQRAERIEALD